MYEGMDNEPKSTLDLNSASWKKIKEMESFIRDQTMSKSKNVGSQMVYGHDEPTKQMEITRNLRSRGAQIARENRFTQDHGFIDKSANSRFHQNINAEHLFPDQYKNMQSRQQKQSMFQPIRDLSPVQYTAQMTDFVN